MLNIPPSLCLQCRGARYLCGFAYCPIMVRFNAHSIKLDISNELQGSSPPSVFVGRFGYPKVNVAPSLPPINGDTSIYDKPELWSNYKIDDILKFRLSLVRGNIRYHINSARDQDSMLIKIQELAIADKPIDVEMSIDKVRSSIHLSEYTPPFGPSGVLSYFRSNNTKVDHRIERLWYDDLNAKNAIIRLYYDKVPISSIVKALSIGILGYKRNKRLVPTRWSITAVDDTISKYLINNLRLKQSIDKYHVYVRRYAMNTFVAILLPRVWQFEWIEAWFPNTTWNMLHYGEPEFMSDHENYKGIDHYAIVGGCYYSARLATAEHLSSINRQAGALLLREIYPGFNIPIGVWFVREQLRAMFKNKPMIFDTLNDALNYAMKYLKIPLNKWIEKSRILSDLKQKSILDYLNI